jgi:phenylalanyl-tRNA synthetase beta chain
VDITNYVMLEYGQPLHAFSLAQVASNKIIVRNARAGETFTTLDGVLRELDETMLLIADPEKALAIAGVMGGENSMVTDDVTTILFESANFEKVNIRMTSKKLGLRTDASAKFEKGIDPALALTAVNRAMELIELLGCGKVVPGTADVFPGCMGEQRKVAYDPARVNALLGTDINAEEMVKTLARVGISTHERVGRPAGSPSAYEAEIPTFRADIHCEADIAEEIARFHGYNNIMSVNMQAVPAPGGKSAERKRQDAVSQTMLGLGYSEALTYPFESPKVSDKLKTPANYCNAIPISNPLGEDFSVMRTLPFDGLLQSLSVNYNRRNASARLFEHVYSYIPKSLPLTELPVETPVLTVAAYDVAGMDFFDIKGDIEQLLLSLGIKDFYFTACDPEKTPFLHPGRAAAVSLGAVNIGFLGELHPDVRNNYQIGARAYIALLDMESVHEAAASHKPAFTPPPKFPSVERDLALKVKTTVSAGEIETAVRERGGALLRDVTLFDVYQGPQLEEGYKSMAYSLRFRASDRTLTDEEVQKPIRSILRHLQEKCSAELRG